MNDLTRNSEGNRIRIRTFFLIAGVMIALSSGCTTEEARVSVSVEDYDYSATNKRLTVRLLATNEGDVAIKNVKCTIEVASTFTPFSRPIASEDVSFGGGKIDEGESRTETAAIEGLELASFGHYKIDIKNVTAEPESGGLFSCPKPTS